MSPLEARQARMFKQAARASWRKGSKPGLKVAAILHACPILLLPASELSPAQRPSIGQTDADFGAIAAPRCFAPGRDVRPYLSK